MSLSRPFDVLRPFKSQAEEFTPRDTLPWERLAANLLSCGQIETSLGCLSPAVVVETQVTWLLDHLALPPHAAILDIGCGPGLYSQRLAQSGYQVTGIDVAQPFLDYAQAQAKKQGLACVYRPLSMFELTFEAEFELVLLINSVLKQLTLAELPALLTRFKAALKPGGHLIAEFSVAPAYDEGVEPTIDESAAFYPCSIWSRQFHLWLMRTLTFPASRERVTHHLILEPEHQPQEYWSRYPLHSVPDLSKTLTRQGFKVKEIFGFMPGQPVQSADQTCFIWAIS
jgi:SAM-dependent methyltransferase